MAVHGVCTHSYAFVGFLFVGGKKDKASFVRTRRYRYIGKHQLSLFKPYTAKSSEKENTFFVFPPVKRNRDQINIDGDGQFFALECINV